MFNERLNLMTNKNTPRFVESIARFTYDEVRSILCECCLYHIPDVRENNQWFHYVNGQSILCSAGKFREHCVRVKEYANDPKL